MPTHIFSSLAVAGTCVVVLAVLYAALRYRGKAGEGFSLLNHFISELGEVGVSRGAWAFNSGLAWMGAFFAAAASLGAAAVGIFRMNNLKPHVRAAMTFFYGGLAMVLTIGLAVLVQPAGQAVVHRIASLLSLLAALAFGSFLALPFLEWLAFFTTIFWLFGMAFFA